MHIESMINDDDSVYNNVNVDIESDIIPEMAVNTPISEDRIISQLSKTGNTEFEFKDIKIDLDNNLYIPSIGKLNEFRRNALETLENTVISKFTREPVSYSFEKNLKDDEFDTPRISLLLNELNLNFDYSKLDHTDNIYVPFKYFINKQYSDILHSFSANLYIYMPSIIRKNYRNLIRHNLENILNNYNIRGFVISNLADLEFLPNNSKYEIIGNYTLNIFNNYTISELNKLNINKITLSPELSKLALTEAFPHDSEIIVYGNTPVMTANYCLLGKANHCYSTCLKHCTSNKYYLKDRMGFNFRIIPDNIETVTTIYNSKTTSIVANDLGYSSFRIDILDENIEEINNAIKAVKSGSRLEGEKFTNGNFNREV